MHRYTIQTRLVLVVTLSIVVTVSLLFVVAIQWTGELLRSQEEIADAEVVRAIRGIVEDRLTAAELALRVVVEDRDVRNALAQQDREALLAYLTPVFESVASFVTRFHMHLPDASSFLRLHAPDQFGDDLTGIRPMVSFVDEELRTVRGLEVGVHGLSHRVVMPIFHEGNHVGSAEFGLSFNEATLREFQERRTGEYFLYIFDGATPQRLAGTVPQDPCPISEEELDGVRAGTFFATNSCSLRDRLLVLPLEDYSGEVVAFLKVVTDRSSLAAGLRSMRFELSMLGLFALVFIPMVVWFLLGKLLSPLSRIVSETRNIADRITSGDLDYRGDIAYRVADFSEVIGEINRMLEALRGAGYQKQAILDGFPGMIYYVDRDLNVLWANEGALEERPGMVGKNCSGDYGDSDFLACEECILIAARESKRIERGTAWFPRDGKERGACWEYAAVPIVRGADTVESIVMIAWDITEKMTIQEELQALNATLETRVTEEVRRRERQEQMVYHHAKLAAIGELAAGMAHEINQPLNTLSFAFENLLNKLPDYPGVGNVLREKQTKIEGSIDRIRGLIEHVRIFSREQSHEFSECFSVNAAVRRALSLVETQYRAHKIAVEAEYADDDPKAIGNPYELEQVVLNLLSNGRDAIESHPRDQNRPPGVIRLTVTAGKSGATVVVEDNGVGIPEEMLQRVCEPFFTTKGPKEGTGLGLSISYGLVDKMGGSIDISSHPGSGTVVRVALPAAPEKGSVALTEEVRL